MPATEFGRVDAGTVRFAIGYNSLDGGLPGRGHADQGVVIQVLTDVSGEETELLRFDCFDQRPHYHYGRQNPNIGRQISQMDKTTAGNPIGWSINQIRDRLPEMVRKAGYDEVAGEINMGLVEARLPEVEECARETALKHRRNVTHNRGDVVIEAGVIRFGLEYRDVPSLNAKGQAIHVLGDVSGEEIELLAFDCFSSDGHYHYGPRNKDERIFWDPTLVPDPLRWTLDQFKEGKLAAMIQRAGYPGIVAELDNELVQSKLPEVEAKALAMAKAAS